MSSTPMTAHGAKRFSVLMPASLPFEGKILVLADAVLRLLSENEMETDLQTFTGFLHKYFDSVVADIVKEFKRPPAPP